MAQLFVNNGKTTLAATLANGATSATITDGSIFPAVAAPDFMLVTLDDGTNIEIVKITAHTAASTTITISRAADGSTQYAGTWAASSTKVECRITKGGLAGVLRNPSVQAVTSSATVTPNADTDDVVTITAQAAGLTLANPSGTPVQGQTLIIRIKDNGTARSISYGTQYRDMGNTRPTTTVVSKTLYLGFIYNATDTKWDLVASAQEL